MFVCARCGSSYNAKHIGVEHCPRCRLRDRVKSPLAFKAFDLGPLSRSRQAADQSEASPIGTSTKTSAAIPSSVT